MKKRNKNKTKKMKCIKSVLFIVFVINFSGVFSQNTQKENDFVYKYLLNKNPLSDSIKDIKGLYYLIPATKFHSNNDEFSIFYFGYNYSHISTNYLLIVNCKNNSMSVLGEKQLEDDLVSLRELFKQSTDIKQSKKLECYERLIQNHESRKTKIRSE